MEGKIIFVTTANSHKGGGVFEVIYQLGKALLLKGVDLYVTWHDDMEAQKDKCYFENVPLIEYEVSNIFPLNIIGYSSNLVDCLTSVNPTILHSHALWMYNSYALNKCKKRIPQLKTIITPHGMLDPWAVNNRKWKKKVVGWLFENENLRTADCIHALNKSEYESIRKYGLKNPVAIIPNGITIPQNVVYNRGKKEKVLLFVGRIHPKKGIAELLEAIHILKGKSPALLNSWKVRIAGWDQLGHTEVLKKKCSELGIDNCISFIGPVLGEEKKKEYLQADAFILPSFSEGLPMSVLEAWSYKLPVIMTDQCNLPEGFDNNAALRVTTEPNSIAEGLERLFEMTNSERELIGDNGYLLVAKEFTWDSIADKTIKLYKWLLEGGEKPSFIEVQ